MKKFGPMVGDTKCPLFDAAFARILSVRPRPDLLFHYTSASACFSIIGDQDRTPTLRASSAFSTNDRMEIRHGAELIVKIAGHYAPSSIVNYVLTPDYKYGEPWQLLPKETCVASFCAESDLLSQWRAYGKSGSGYAIGFTSSELNSAGSKYNFRLMPVIYRQAEQEAVLETLFAEAREVMNDRDRAFKYFQALNPNLDEQTFMPDERAFWGRLLRSAVKLALTFKNAGFAEEKEWRLISEYPLHLVMKFRVTDRGIVPFVEIDLPRTSVRELWLGPALDQEFNEKMVDLFMQLEYAPSVQLAVKRSTIPFRSL